MNTTKNIHCVWIWLFCVFLTTDCFAVQQGVASASNVETTEAEVVFRISKTFFDETVSEQEIVSDIPFTGRILGMNCHGVIHGVAHAKIGMQNNGRFVNLTIQAQGDGSSVGTCSQGPLVVISPMWGPFTTTTNIRFDGHTFTNMCTTANIDLQGCVQEVRGRRNRPAGRVLGRGIKPLVQKLMPRAVAQAKPIAEQHVRDHVNKEFDAAIAKFNQRNPVSESINRLFPETRTWTLNLSTTNDYIQVAYGPSNSTIPNLKKIETENFVPVIEVWLKSTTEEARALSELAGKPLAKQLVNSYLEKTLPKLSALGDQRYVEAEGKWLRIRIGHKVE